MQSYRFFLSFELIVHFESSPLCTLINLTNTILKRTQHATINTSYTLSVMLAASSLRRGFRTCATGMRSSPRLALGRGFGRPQLALAMGAPNAYMYTCAHAHCQRRFASSAFGASAWSRLVSSAAAHADSPRRNTVSRDAAPTAPGPISHTTVMSTATGLTWVDIEGAPGLFSSHSLHDSGAVDPRLSDAEFVMAMRRSLRMYGVHESLLSEISRVVLLPLTVVAHHHSGRDDGALSDPFDTLAPFGGHSYPPQTAAGWGGGGGGGGGPQRLPRRDVCFVCRYARVEEHLDASVTIVERARQEMEERAAGGGWGYGKGGASASVRKSISAPAMHRSLSGSGRLAHRRALMAPLGRWAGAWGRVFAPFRGASGARHSSKSGEAAVFETIQQLSSRLTVFILPHNNTIITVHRYPIRSVSQLRHDWHRRMRRVTLDGLLRKLVIDCAQSFLDMERVRASEVDVLEEHLFATAPATAGYWMRFRMALLTRPDDTFRHSLEALYGYSREASAYCRILQPLLRAYEEARVASGGNTKNIDLVEHRIAAAISMCEGLREQTQSLLSLQFSVGAGQLEELFRFLTVFSTIFIPLEFIASLGGAEVGFVSVILDNNDISLSVVVCLFAGALLMTVRWLRRMVF